MKVWLVALAMLATVAPASPAAEEPRIAMSLRHGGSGQWGPLLTVTLTLESPTPVTVAARDLPWGSPYNGLVLVVALADGHGEVLPRVFPFDEPMDPPPDVLLQPGKSVSGDVYVANQVGRDAIADALSRGDVLVFWSFKLKLRDAKDTNRVGGWLLVPRAK